MKEAKALVRAKLVELQRRIVELTRALAKQEERSRRREREVSLLEIADAFDNLEDLIRAKQEHWDKSARRMAGNVRAIHRKLLRHLETCHIVPMDLAGRKATMELCKVIETQESPEQADETILCVVKMGYIDPRGGEAVRKAEVITVRNSHDQGSE